MLLLVAISLGALGYVYGGYLVALRLLVWVRGPRLVRRADVTPTLTLVISAFNEAAVIRKKLDNAIALDYPAALRRIIVISDASDDGTDDIVREYAGRGVDLFRQPERRGKTAGLNALLPTLTSDVVVFSDANAIYDTDALRMLTRNFADPEVGCVTGEARYLVDGETAADIGERLYWRYEMLVKRLETALGSMVGGDGAIYAIRRALWKTLPDNAINDFLNPLQIVAAGWRAVYEPKAICYEETAGAVRIEYKRRIRIVSRSWRAVFQADGVLNPFKVGLFAWSVFSHKVLRWMTGGFALLAVVGMSELYVEWLLAYPMATSAITLTAAVLGALTKPGRKIASLLGYFVAITIASVMGMLKGTSGRVSGVWTTPRQQESASGLRPKPSTVPVGALFLAAALVTVVAAIVAFPFVEPAQFARVVFWGATVILGYVYAGYPMLLGLLRSIKGRRPVQAPIEPTVALFIAANDEASIIEAKLRNALAVDYPAHRYSIVVASDGSVDETNSIVRRLAAETAATPHTPPILLLDTKPRRGKIAVVNDGMRHVRAEVVIFSDANTFLDRDAIRRLVRNFADPDVGAVSGDVRLEGERASLASSEDLYYWYERWVQRAESDIGSMVGVDGALYAIRRNLFVPPPDDTILDDMAIPMAVVRAGYRVVYEADATAHERGSESATEEFSRKARVIAGAVQFLARHESAVPVTAAQMMFSMVSHKALRWLTPAFGGAAFAASTVLAVTAPGYAIATAGLMTLVMLGLAGCSSALRRVSVVGLAHYFCLVQAAAGVGFIRGLSGRQSVRWRRFTRLRGEAA